MAVRRISVCGAILFSLMAAAGALAQARSAGLRDRHLYLNATTIDTSRAANLKRQPPVRFEAPKAYVIQLDGPMTPETRRKLEQIGARLGDYLPSNAFVARLDRAAPKDLAALNEVDWVGEYQTSWKLEPQIGQRVHVTPSRQEMARRGKVPVVITLFADRQASDVTGALRAMAGADLRSIEQVGGNATLTAIVPKTSISGIAQLDAVEYVEEAPEVTLRNVSTRWIVQSNVTNVTPLYDNGITGTGQILGNLDGKMDINHCAFKDPVNNTPGPGHRKVVAYNTTFGADTHGTHTSGIAIGQDYSGSTGETRGIAYGARIAFGDIPAFTETGSINAFTLHHSQGARVHTNSWGDDGTTSYNSLCRGIDSFSYSNEDDLVLFAVTNTSTLKNPENAKDLLAVGACQDAPNQANFCSGGTGPTADGRRKPEIYAPGCSIQSAAANTGCSTTGLTGTSMACPAVAGVGMLVRQYYTNGYYPSGTPTLMDGFTPTGALIKATLLNSAVDMTGISGYPSNQEGWGRVLSGDALFFPGDTRKLAKLADIRNASGLNTNAVNEYTVTVSGSTEKMKVTLVWTDPPASAGTGTALAMINDLDLEVVSPASDLYLGNVFSGGVSATGGTRDSKNNVEQVHVNSPLAGNWTIRVKATAVNQGPQGYALVATGDLFIAPPDCNSNGVPDDQDIALGTSQDCNSNGRPDECESQADCNSNGIADICDLALATSLDCNHNNIPDECEVPPIAAGNDCNSNGIPDDCESQTDCNSNGIADICDLASGASQDCNTDGIPDECQLAGTVSLLSADFEGGLPVGWTATGLWHASGSCPRSNTCNPTTWAYYGQDSSCNFATGSTTSGALTATAVSIPAGASSVMLTYCSAYGGEAGNSNSSGYDWAWLAVNGVEKDDVSFAGDQLVWGTRTVNLTAYAGQTITLAWRFDSRDASFNSELGWQIDNVQVIAIIPGMLDCNGNGVPDTCDVQRGSSRDCNRNGQPDECEASVACPCGNTILGDMNGDNFVNGGDAQQFVDCQLSGDPTSPECACADMDTNLVFDANDVDLFVQCSLGLGCP